MKKLENMNIIHQEENALAFPSLSRFSNVAHGYSLREKGVSEGYYQSLNLGFHNGDDPKKVRQNFEIWALSFGISVKQIVLSNQTHSTNIKVVTKEDAGKGIIRPVDYEAIDGLVTKEKNLALCTLHADCIPVFFFDEKKEVIGLVHSGWRGTYGQIASKMIHLMKDEFQSNPKDIHIGIGPGISLQAYEIDEELAFKFMNKFENSTEFVKEGRQGHYQLDLPRCIYLDLIKEGVLAENIEISKVCTATYSNLLFSHRASQGKRGNSAALIMLK